LERGDRPKQRWAMAAEILNVSPQCTTILQIATRGKAVVAPWLWMAWQRRSPFSKTRYTTKVLHPTPRHHDPNSSVIPPPIPPDIAGQHDDQKKVTILATKPLA